HSPGIRRPYSSHHPCTQPYGWVMRVAVFSSKADSALCVMPKKTLQSKGTAHGFEKGPVRSKGASTPIIQRTICEPEQIVYNVFYRPDRPRQSRAGARVVGPRNPGHKEWHDGPASSASRRRFLNGQVEGPGCRALADRAQF